METMLIRMTKFHKPHYWFLVLVLLLSACSRETTTIPVESPTLEAPVSTSTPLTPTSTPIPAAVVVNGERISLAWFESEVQRYLLAQESLSLPMDDEGAARDFVLNDVIDQVLLAQAARDAGVGVTDVDVQARLDELADETDLSAWMAEWGYTEMDLFQALKLQMLGAKQRDLILEGMPQIVEQVELRQVFAYTEQGAKNALVSLNSGQDFEEVAFVYDPVSGGYLGWTPRGYLLIPAVEEVAFTLPVGAYSDVIESEIGYHIVLVLDKEERLLSNDARTVLQRQAVIDWLEEKRETSTIEVLID